MPGGTPTATLQDQPDKFLRLATNRTGTMQGELNGTPPVHNIAGMTVFPSMFDAHLAPHRTPGRTGARSGPETIGEVGETAAENRRQKRFGVPNGSRIEC